MRDNITPEEKLLRLIRKGKKKEDEEITPASVFRPKIKLIPNIRKIILFCFLSSCLYLIFSFIYPWIGLKEINPQKIALEKISEEKITPESQIKPFEFYQKVMQNRKLFGTQPTQITQTTPSTVATDLIKDINLVGIISGDNPQVVIEDKNLKKTYYLNKGQFISEFQLEDIQEGKVILNYKGQRFELYL
jgi:type II secretory pathway component PulC